MVGLARSQIPGEVDVRQVTLVCGPPCAGKTTYVRERAQSGDLILDLDDIAQQQGSTRRHHHDRRTAAHAEWTWRAQAAALAGIPDVRAWVIRCAPTINERVALVDATKATSVVVLLPAISELMARAAGRPDPGKTRATIYHWLRAYRPATGDVLIGGAVSSTPRANGHRYRVARKAVLEESDLCHLCGHRGADTADHLVSRSHGGAVADVGNLAPAHGVRGCPTCGRKCNQERGDGAHAVRRRSRDW